MTVWIDMGKTEMGNTVAPAHQNLLAISDKWALYH